MVVSEFCPCALHVYNCEHLHRDEYGDETLQDLVPGGPWHVLAISAVYAILVTKIGPAFMRDRKPYELSTAIKLYNVVNIVANTAIFIQAMLATSYGVDCFRCFVQPKYAHQWWLSVSYFYLKIFDMLDTVFFIMRKKFNQVSTLHVIHHAGK